MSEKVGHGFLVVNPSDCFCQQDGYVDGFDFVTLQLLHVMGNGVGHHNLKIKGLNEPTYFHHNPIVI